MRECDWHEQAKRILKAEMVRRGISNDELVNLLKKIDVNETKGSVANKISRGSFSAAFFLQCLNALKCKNIDPSIIEDVN